MGSTALRNTESSVCHQDLANNDVFLKEWKCQKRLGAKGQMSHLSPTEKEKFTYGVLIIPVTSTSQKMGGKEICFSFIGQDLRGRLF